MEATGDGVAGIDLGINNLAVVAFQDSTSILYSGRGLLAADQWLQKKAKRCKPSGWRSGQASSRPRPSEKCRRYRKKAGNIRRLACHNVSRSIIDECVKRGVATIVIGKLKGIRNGKDYGKRMNQKLHAWPFAELVRQIRYKSEEVGIEVIEVSEAYTSQTCCFCGVTDKSSRVHRGLYRCRHCGAVVNADVNGAFNILNKVSPVLALPGIGVEADLPGLPSPPDRAARIGKAGLPDSQIEPTYVAKFNLRNWSIRQLDCNSTPGASSGLQPAGVGA